jgi:hypothetical protein
MASELMLQREGDIFAAHLEEWRRDHLGEFVVIKGNDVVGFYPQLDAAFADATRRFGLEEFLLRQIIPGDAVNVSVYGRQLLSA